MDKQLDNNFNVFLLKLGKKIKTIREKEGITQAQMYLEPYSFERRNWQRIEAGQKNITIKTLFTISKKLKVSPNDLLDFD